MRTALTLLAPLALALAGRTAAADPVETRLLTAPTAWLPPGGALTATASADQLGGGSAFLGFGLGDLAFVEVGADSEVRTCTNCIEPADERWFPRAAFRLAARQDAWFRGMPALAIGLKNTFAARGFGAFREPRVTEAYVVASRIVGPLRLHGGVAAIAAGFGDFELSPQLRPLGGFEIRIKSLPRSTFIGDVGWSTRLEQEPEPSTRRGPRLEAMFGVGARYQFFDWATIELGVRVPQEEGLAAARAMVRLNGVWELTTPEKRRLELK
jgi:hypothetical protein